MLRITWTDNMSVLGAATDAPIALIIIAFMVGVGLIVTANVFDILDAKDLGTAGNATRTTLESNTWSGYDLSALLPIVLGAAAIISVLVGAFRRIG